MDDNVKVVGLSIGCIICGEPARLTPEEEMSIYHGKVIYKVCDKCSDAVMRVRNTMDTLYDIQRKMKEGVAETQAYLGRRSVDVRKI